MQVQQGLSYFKGTSGHHSYSNIVILSAPLCRYKTRLSDTLTWRGNCDGTRTAGNQCRTNIRFSQLHNFLLDDTHV